MKKNPQVSVIIPCFNAELTLKECVNSVLQQNFPDLECLLIDDGSNDKTPELITELIAQDERVRALQHKEHCNLGVAASRNLGIERARAKFIAFLDADDAWLPHKLTLQLEIMEKMPAIGMTFGEVLICESDRTDIPMIEQSLRQEKKPAKISEKFKGEPGSSAEVLLFEPKNYAYNWIHSPTPLIRRSLFDKGIRFIGPPRLTVQYEDYLMWLVLSFHCEFFAIDEPLALYRLYKQQYCSKFLKAPGVKSRHLRGLEQVFDNLLLECAEEISQRSLNSRIRNRFSSVIVSSVENIPAEELPEILSISIRKHFFVGFLRAYLIRIIHKCHYAIRKTWIFHKIRPLWKFLCSKRTG